MTSYVDLRKTTGKARAKSYKDGGGVKKSGTTVNIVMPSARGESAPKALPIAPAGGMGGAPSPMPASPPVPMPPSAGPAGIAALGAPPMMAKGGKVKGKPALANGGKAPQKAGAASALGRMQKAKARKGK